MKEIEDDINRWKYTPCSWIGRISTVEHTQGNVQIQCNPYQNTSDIFYRTRTNNFKIYMETQKTLNNQNDLEKEQQSWRNHAPCLQTIL